LLEQLYLGLAHRYYQYDGTQHEKIARSPGVAIHGRSIQRRAEQISAFAPANRFSNCRLSDVAWGYRFCGLYARYARRLTASQMDLLPTNDNARTTTEKADSDAVRVHELAKELGVTSKEVLLACSECGEFVKSASSTLPPRLVRKLREDLGGRQSPISATDYGVSSDLNHPTVADDEGFGAAYEKARRASRSTTFTSPKPGAIESAIYRQTIDPRRTRRGGYTPEERDRAERLTKQWASTWLPDLIDWIRLSGGEHPDVAVRLSRAGLCAADAELRIGFGRMDPSRNTMFECVMKGTVGIKDAVRQVQEFRRSEQATGSS